MSNDDERLSDRTDNSESEEDLSPSGSVKFGSKISDTFSIEDYHKTIDKFETLVEALDSLFASSSPWECKQKWLVTLLQNVDLTTTEINKYTFFDNEKPYTRNLVASDGKHYTLLILCWNAGMESKIHNHPCDGCYIRSIRGCIKETVYSTDEETGEIKQSSTRFCCEGQVSFMSDDLGLHKVGNPHKDMGSVTLHLYTPPFGTCKVWSDQGKDQLSKFEEGKIGFFSVYGHRTPHLEGRPGQQSKLMSDIRTSSCCVKTAAAL